MSYTTKSDPFKSNFEVVKRLLKEWDEYGKLIVAFDYDNTIHDYHNNDFIFPQTVKQLVDLGRMGCDLICFTSCDSSRFDEIMSKCLNLGIACMGVNVDSTAVPYRGRKVYYNVLYDDRAGLSSVLGAMEVVIQQMRRKIKDVHPFEDSDLIFESGGYTKCAYSGKPFLKNSLGEFVNPVPAAFDEFREENDITPSIDQILERLKIR